jgi:hypothetical protein
VSIIRRLKVRTKKRHTGFGVRHRARQALRAYEQSLRERLGRQRMWYILDDQHRVVGPVSTLEYIAWDSGDGHAAFEKRRVAETLVREGTEERTEIRSADGQVIAVVPPTRVWVSTVFLGLNHAWDDGPPLLFETMVFRGGLSDEVRRYSTWDEAVRGHIEMVWQVEDALRVQVLGSGGTAEEERSDAGADAPGEGGAG